MIKIRDIIIHFWWIFCILILLIVVWREFYFSRLPDDFVQLPVSVQEEFIEAPPRPGIQGIVITGPVIEPLFFSIDLSQGSVRALDWGRLMAIDPHADVKIACQVDDRGRLFFAQKDVLMGGHTKAGMMIQQAMKTWVFKPYKSGNLRFWFNLPSKGKKLLIGTREMVRRSDIPAHIPVYDGQLHLIQGISAEEIGVGRHY
jgi:hypothetical protein